MNEIGSNNDWKLSAKPRNDGAQEGWMRLLSQDQNIMQNTTQLKYNELFNFCKIEMKFKFNI